MISLHGRAGKSSGGFFMRKSFILYTDALGALDCLSDEQAGQLFKAIAAHAKGAEHSLTGIMLAVFNPFKTQLDRDNEAYKKVCQRNKENGKNGGRPKGCVKKPKGTQRNPKNPDGFLENPKNPDTDTDTDSKTPPSPPRGEPPGASGGYWVDYGLVRLNRADYDALRALYPGTGDQFDNFLGKENGWMEDKLPPEDQRSWFIILRKRLEKLKREASA
jgi:hypothetical protein